MEKMIVDSLAFRTPTPAEERAIELKGTKMRIRKAFIKEKCRNLNLEITSFKNSNEMNNDEVRFATKESRDRKKESHEIISLWQMYFEESVSLDNEMDRQFVSAAVDNLMYTINSKVESLSVEDQRRG